MLQFSLTAPILNFQVLIYAGQSSSVERLTHACRCAVSCRECRLWQFAHGHFRLDVFQRYLVFLRLWERHLLRIFFAVQPLLGSLILLLVHRLCRLLLLQLSRSRWLFVPDRTFPVYYLVLTQTSFFHLK